jgi:hypothetical protein
MKRTFQSSCGLGIEPRLISHTLGPSPHPHGILIYAWDQVAVRDIAAASGKDGLLGEKLVLSYRITAHLEDSKSRGMRKHEDKISALRPHWTRGPRNAWQLPHIPARVAFVDFTG